MSNDEQSLDATPAELVDAARNPESPLHPYLWGAPTNNDIPPIGEQNEEGVYFEEVGMLVDSLVDQIRSGHLASKDSCRVPLEEAVEEASHINSDELCARVLRWSHHPTAYFFNHGNDSGTDPDHRAGLATSQPWDWGRKAFPWRTLAFDAMEEDVRKELFSRQEFKALPEDDSPADHP